MGVQQCWLLAVSSIKDSTDDILSYYVNAGMPMSTFIMMQAAYNACVEFIGKPIILSERIWVDASYYRRCLYRTLIFTSELFDLFEVLRKFLPAEGYRINPVLDAIKPFIDYLCKFCSVEIKFEST